MFLLCSVVNYGVLVCKFGYGVYSNRVDMSSYVEEGVIFYCENRRVATIFEVLNLQELLQIKPENGEAENVGIDWLHWQVCLLLTAEDNSYNIKFVSIIFLY